MYVQQPTFSSCNFLEKVLAKNIYSLAETAKLNDLNPYYYFEYLLSELPRYLAYDNKTDTVDMSQLDMATLEELLPWSPAAKQKCFNGRH